MNEWVTYLPHWNGDLSVCSETTGIPGTIIAGKVRERNNGGGIFPRFERPAWLLIEAFNAWALKMKRKTELNWYEMKQLISMLLFVKIKKI